MLTSLDTRVNIVATGQVTLLYEGMLSTRFNVSYQLRNCTHNCHNYDTRFNKTCSYDMVCDCAAGYMGPQCHTRICPNNCNNQGQCVSSTGICKCDSSSSGLSCDTRSSAHITWSVKSFDWVPHGQPIMGPRMGHSAVVMTVNGRGMLVIFGGYSLYNLYNDTWLFDTVRQTWSRLNTTSPAPVPTHFHSVVVTETSMCIIGGITDAGLSSELWCLTPGDPGTWTSLDTTWTRLDTTGLAPVAGASAVTYTSNTWYLFGGVTDAGPSNTLSRYDVASGVWTTVQTKGYIEPMYGHTMSLYKNSLYVIGHTGYYKYNITTSTWISVLPRNHLPAILRSRYHCLAAKAGVVYVTGGMMHGDNLKPTLNKDLYAIQLETGSYIKLTSEQDNTASVLSSQLLYHNNKLYVVGGFNGSVHSAVLSYDLLDSICFLIKDAASCSEFGCAWCDSQHSPKPCIPTFLPGCPRLEPRSTLHCRLFADCSTCSSHRTCAWSATSRTCSASAFYSNTCTNTCWARSNCTTCHEDAQCTWYKGSCADSANVAELERQCPVECSDITSCTGCTVKLGCSWSKTLSTCLSAAQLDWSCLFERCDLLVSPVQCPVSCSQHASCSVCREHNECGWCQHDLAHAVPLTRHRSRGTCMAGDFSAPGYGDCDTWHFFTCPLENECELDVHTCRADQLCVDLATGYNCTCHNGTVNSPLLDKCVPSCEAVGCAHGLCVAVETCVCWYGYYGASCREECDCSGHSKCGEQGECLECQGNSAGTNCELCLEDFIRNGTQCVTCSAVCNDASNTCTPISGSRLQIDNIKCEDCANNTKGNHCQECASKGFFQDPTTGRCRRCMCNGHASSCDPKTGLNCPCQNNTMSSFKQGGNPCLSSDTCYKNQCDVCKKGYSGDPTGASWCYENLPFPEKLYVFAGRANIARPFNVEIQGVEDHWIYIEMRNMSGVVYATLDPRMYTQNRLVQRGITRYYNTLHPYPSLHPPLRPILPWITGVDNMSRNRSNVLVDLNCERRFIKFTPERQGSRQIIYIVVETYKEGGNLTLTWYVASPQNNYYLMLNVLMSGVILLMVFYYLANNALHSLLYLLHQRADNNRSISNGPKFIVSVAVDVGGGSWQNVREVEEQDCWEGSSRMLTGYRRLPQSEVMPKVRPIAVQEVTPAGARSKCGLGTVLIRLPGPPGQKNRLILGSTLLRTHRKTLDLESVAGDDYDLIRETSL